MIHITTPPAVRPERGRPLVGRHLRKLSRCLAALALGALLCLLIPIFLARGLDTLAFPDLEQRYMGALWLAGQNGLRVRYLGWFPSRRERFALSRAIPEHNGDLRLARDFRLREVPRLLRALEQDAWPGEQPRFATTLMLSRMALAAESSLQRTQASAPFWSRPLRTHQLRVFQAWRREAFLNDTEPVPGSEVPWDVMKLSLVAQLEGAEAQQRLATFMDGLAQAPGQVEVRMALALKEGLVLGSLQTGCQRLARHLRCFSRADLVRYKQGKRYDDGVWHYSGPEEKDLLENPPTVWSVLDVPTRRATLDRLRAGDDRPALLAEEQKTLLEVLKAIQLFPYVLSEQRGSSKTYVPDMILESRYAQCVGKSIMIHAYLQALGIREEAISFSNHMAIAAQTSDGQQWYLEGTSTRALSNTKALLLPGTLYWEMPLGMKGGSKDAFMVPFVLGPSEHTLASGTLANLGFELQSQATPRGFLAVPFEVSRNLAWETKYSSDELDPAKRAVSLAKLLKAFPNDASLQLDARLMGGNAPRLGPAASDMVYAVRPAGAKP